MKSRLSKPFLAWCLVLSAASAQAEPETYVFDTQHTYPNFEVGHLGFSVRRGWA